MLVKCVLLILLDVEVDIMGSMWGVAGCVCVGYYACTSVTTVCTSCEGRSKGIAKVVNINSSVTSDVF